ncbi:MAG: hypothetical protein HY040_28655 [Planctomycetes bacterium]|nr:hypothetical protein [Planctomycetota bacterium]
MSLPQQIYDLLHQRPFKPFRVFLKDGATYDVRHAYNNVIGTNLFSIAIPDPSDPDAWPIALRTEIVPMERIDRVECLTSAAMGGT